MAQLALNAGCTCGAVVSGVLRIDAAARKIGILCIPMQVQTLKMLAGTIKLILVLKVGYSCSMH